MRDRRFHLDQVSDHGTNRNVPNEGDISGDNVTIAFHQYLDSIFVYPCDRGIRDERREVVVGLEIHGDQDGSRGFLDEQDGNSASDFAIVLFGKVQNQMKSFLF